MRTRSLLLPLVISTIGALGSACADDAPPPAAPETPRDVRFKVEAGTASALVATPLGLVIATTPFSGLGRGAIWRVTDDRRVEQIRETPGLVRALDVSTTAAGESFVWSEVAGGLYASIGLAADPPAVLRPVAVNVLSFVRTGDAFTYATPTGIGRTDAALDQDLGPGDRAIASDGAATFVLTMRVAPPAARRPWELSKLTADGAAATIGSGEAAPGSGAMAHALVTDATHVYAAVAGQGVVAVPKTGGAGVTVLAPRPGASLPQVRDGYVYFADNSDGAAAVLRVPTGGGAAEPVVLARAAIVTALAVDATSVYWAGVDGGVYRAAKP